jgi:hypothetical protein
MKGKTVSMKNALKMFERHGWSARQDFNPLYSKEKIANWRLGGGGNANQRVHRDVFHAAFNFANIFGVQVGDLSQFFLSQFRVLAMLPNRFSQQLAMSHGFGRHDLTD